MGHHTDMLFDFYSSIQCRTINSLDTCKKTSFSNFKLELELKLIPFESNQTCQSVCLVVQ